MPWVKAGPPWMIYDAVKAHRPHARLWAPSDGKNGLPDALDWVSDVSRGDELVVLAGSLYPVADFYQFVEPGL